MELMEGKKERSKNLSVSLANKDKGNPFHLSRVSLMVAITLFLFCREKRRVFSLLSAPLFTEQMAKNTMSGAAPPWVFGSSTDNRSRAGKRHHSTTDQARTFAVELGPELASAFDILSHKTALVLRAYVASLHQE